MEFIKKNILNIISLVLGVISVCQMFINHNLDWKIIILLSSGWCAAILNIIIIFYISNKNDKDVRELAEKIAEIKSLQERLKNSEIVSTFLANSQITNRTTRRQTKGKE